ncbi:MAG TPA: TlpA disulfide reductase family protein [Holophagaceae bacterium]
MRLCRSFPVFLLACLPLVGGENPKVALLAKEGHWEASGWAAHLPMLGQPAPKLDLSGWFKEAVAPEDMKGKILLVDFWATWCGPCWRSIPHNNDLAKKYADRGVMVIGACGGGNEDRMRDVALLQGIAYPTARTTKATTEAWKVQWWPTYAVVDRNGVLRAIGLRPDYVEPFLDALLEEQPAK